MISNWTHRLRALLIASVVLLAGCALPLPIPADKGIPFGLMGDTPYSSLEVAQLDSLIDELNAEELAFVVHVGDITSGRGPCTDAWFEARKKQFARIRHPFILIPGDNDWTDCHRSGMDPMERLAKFRELFESGSTSLGQRTIPLDRQSSDPRFAARFGQYSEHMRWKAGTVLFITLNVQGSNNNLGRTPAMDAEYRERMQAVMAWIDDGAAIVQRDRLEGLVILVQANPDFEETWVKTTRPGAPDGFADFRDKLRQLASSLAKPILFVHGDTHSYQVNKPLDDVSGKRIENFVRLEVSGSPWVQWVRGSLHPGAAVPFYAAPARP